jgi:hypothetical protein
MSSSPLRVVTDVLSEDSFALAEEGWLRFGLLSSLAVFFVVKTVMLALIVSFPAPTGIFLPTLAAGAVFGRFFGELFYLITGPPMNGRSTGFVAASFATIGCAAFGASVTHTMSTAVMVMELTGQVQLLLPVLMGSIVSFVISRFLTGKVGLYERIALDRKLPLLFDLPISMFELTASELMVKVNWEFPTIAEGGPVTVLESHCTLQSLDAILDNKFDPASSYAVVESLQSRTLMGFVSGYDLLQYRSEIVHKLEFANSNLGRSRHGLTNSFALVEQASTTRDVLDQVQESISPIKLSKGYFFFIIICLCFIFFAKTVDVVVGPASGIAFVHQLMSLNGQKTDILPVCELGRLVGLVYRADVIARLMPKRFAGKTL